MKNIKKFSTNADLERYKRNTDNYSELPTKMFYVEDEEELHIGSGKVDIVIDMAPMNTSLQGLAEYHISTYVDSNNNHLDIKLLYTRITSGFRGYLGTIIADDGYAIDENNSAIYMYKDNGEKTRLNRGTDYNVTNGQIYWNCEVTGNISIEYVAKSVDNLIDNNITVFIKGYNITTETDIKNITNLYAGQEYTITLSSQYTEQNINTPGVTINSSNTAYGVITNNILKTYGNNGEGGSFTLTVFVPNQGQYKSATVQQTYVVYLQEPELVGLNDIPNTVNAGEVIDLSNLSTPSNGNILITANVTNNVISNTNEALTTKQYQTQCNGIEGSVTFTIKIGETTNYTSATYTKTVNVQLLDNTINWAWDASDDLHDYETFNWYAGRTYDCNVSATNGEGSVIYTVNNSTYGEAQGNQILVKSNGKNNAALKITATIPANGNYKGASITKDITVKLDTPNVSWTLLNGTEITIDNSLNTAITATNTTGIIQYSKYTTPITIDSELITPNNSTYTIDNSGVLSVANYNDNTDKTIFIIKAHINAAGNYDEWEDYRYVIINLKQNNITWSSGEVLYLGLENEKTATPEYAVNAKTKLSSLTLYHLNEDGTQGAEYDSSLYSLALNAAGYSFIIKPDASEENDYILAVATTEAKNGYGYTVSTRRYQIKK